jgi:hypothetical protein
MGPCLRWSSRRRASPRLVRKRLTIVLEQEASQLLGGTLLDRLEPLDAHPELGRKLAQRFHRGRARPRFDPADVGVGDAGLGKVSL